jgi:hypothetical protein
VRFGWSWPTGRGRRMWVSMPWWALLAWLPFWLAGMAVVLCLWLLLMLAEGIVWLLRLAGRVLSGRLRHGR